MKKLVVYCYSGCGTCKKALAWLSKKGIDHEVRPIRDTPPTKAELRAALTSTGSLRALFNTSGGDYKALDLKTKLPTMSDDEALELLASRGNLVKRPFVVAPSGFLVGFDEARWSAALE